MSKTEIIVEEKTGIEECTNALNETITLPYSGGGGHVLGRANPSDSISPINRFLGELHNGLQDRSQSNIDSIANAASIRAQEFLSNSSIHSSTLRTGFRGRQTSNEIFMAQAFESSLVDETSIESFNQEVETNRPILHRFMSQFDAAFSSLRGFYTTHPELVTSNETILTNSTYSARTFRDNWAERLNSAIQIRLREIEASTIANPLLPDRTGLPQNFNFQVLRDIVDRTVTSTYSLFDISENYFIESLGLIGNFIFMLFFSQGVELIETFQQLSFNGTYPYLRYLTNSFAAIALRYLAPLLVLEGRSSANVFWARETNRLTFAFVYGLNITNAVFLNVQRYMINIYNNPLYQASVALPQAVAEQGNVVQANAMTSNQANALFFRDSWVVRLFITRPHTFIMNRAGVGPVTAGFILSGGYSVVFIGLVGLSGLYYHSDGSYFFVQARDFMRRSLTAAAPSAAPPLEESRRGWIRYYNFDIFIDDVVYYLALFSSS